jgi:hypothetical protein
MPFPALPVKHDRAIQLTRQLGVYPPGWYPAADCAVSRALALLLATHGYNNPVKYTDPSGHKPCDDQYGCQEGIVGDIGGGTGGGGGDPSNLYKGNQAVQFAENNIDTPFSTIDETEDGEVIYCVSDADTCTCFVAAAINAGLPDNLKINPFSMDEGGISYFGAYVNTDFLLMYLQIKTDNISTEFNGKVDGPLKNSVQWNTWISTQTDIELGDLVFYHATGASTSYSHVAIISGMTQRDGVNIPTIIDSNAYSGANPRRDIDATNPNGSYDRVLIFRMRIH